MCNCLLISCLRSSGLGCGLGGQARVGWAVASMMFGASSAMMQFGVGLIDYCCLLGLYQPYHQDHFAAYAHVYPGRMQNLRNSQRLSRTLIPTESVGTSIDNTQTCQAKLASLKQLQRVQNHQVQSPSTSWSADARLGQFCGPCS